MSSEDRKWLEQALKQYTFNDVDRLKEICIELKGDQAVPAHMGMEKTKILNLLDELMELLELHGRNSLNLCLCGGMATIMDIIFNSSYEDARREACSIFSFTNQNNLEVQNFTCKLGCMNLLHQYVRETNVKNREGIISAVSSYLRGINTDGKREFLAEYSGLTFLKAAL
jgi:hypothetical protein